MPTPINRQLERMIRASEAAGKVVLASEVDGARIRLTYADESKVEQSSPADLIRWNRVK